MSAASTRDDSAGYRVVRLSDVEPERVNWLWSGRLPAGKLVVLDGDPSVGKSTVALDLAARLTNGSLMPDGSPGSEPTNVVLLTAEDGLADTVRPRLDAVGADPNRVVVFESVPVCDKDGKRVGERAPSIPGDLAALEDLVKKEGAALVIVDVLNAFLSGAVDSHRDQDVRGALMPFAKMADRTGATVLVLRHLNKSGGSAALYRGGGSIGIIGAARAGLLVAIDPEDETRRVLAVTKSNLAVEAPSLAYRLVSDEERGCARVVWEGETGHKATDLLRPREDDEERTVLDEAAEWLTEVLANGAVPAGEVRRLAKEDGISANRTLDRARERIGALTRRKGFGPGSRWVWELPHSRQPMPIDVIDANPQNPDIYDINGEISGDNGPEASGRENERKTTVELGPVTADASA